MLSFKDLMTLGLFLLLKNLLRIIRIMNLARMRELLCVFVCEISKDAPQHINGAKYFQE